jgi:hypothetical protein
MGDIAQVKEAFLGSVKADADKSRLEFGGTEVSFHCDKFNTRVVKGLEDVVGVDDAHKLLSAKIPPRRPGGRSFLLSLSRGETGCHLRYI